MKIFIILFIFFLPITSSAQYSCENEIFGDTTYNGICEEYYPSGALQYSTTFKGGVKHGPFKELYENGKLKAQAYFDEWEILGESTRYYPNGPVKLKIITDSVGDGSLTSYFATGEIKTTGFYTCGFETGIWRTYDIKGNIISEVEKNNYENLLERKKQAEIDNKNPNRKYEIVIVEDWDAGYTFMNDED